MKSLYLFFAIGVLPHYLFFNSSNSKHLTMDGLKKTLSESEDSDAHHDAELMNYVSPEQVAGIGFFMDATMSQKESCIADLKAYTAVPQRRVLPLLVQAIKEKSQARQRQHLTRFISMINKLSSVEVHDSDAEEFLVVLFILQKRRIGHTSLQEVLNKLVSELAFSILTILLTKPGRWHSTFLRALKQIIKRIERTERASTKAATAKAKRLQKEAIFQQAREDPFLFTFNCVNQTVLGKLCEGRYRRLVADLNIQGDALDLAYILKDLYPETPSRFIDRRLANDVVCDDPSIFPLTDCPSLDTCLASLLSLDINPDTDTITRGSISENDWYFAGRLLPEHFRTSDEGEKASFTVEELIGDWYPNIEVGPSLEEYTTDENCKRRVQKATDNETRWNLNQENHAFRENYFKIAEKKEAIINGLRITSEVLNIDSFLNDECTRYRAIKLLDCLDAGGILIANLTTHPARYLQRQHGSSNVVYRDFSVCSQRPQEQSRTWSSPMQVHFKTNIRIRSDMKYRFHFEGYNWGLNQSVNCIAVGSAGLKWDRLDEMQYFGWPEGWDKTTCVSYSGGVESLRQYFSSDGYVTICLQARTFLNVGISATAWLVNHSIRYPLTASWHHSSEDL